VIAVGAFLMVKNPNIAPNRAVDVWPLSLARVLASQILEGDESFWAISTLLFATFVNFY